MQRTGDASIASRSAEGGNRARAGTFTAPICTTWERMPTPSSDEERLAARPDGHPSRRLPGARSLQDVPHVVEPVLLRADQVRVARTRAGEAGVRVLGALDAHQLRVLRLELHVRDRDGDRRAQALPVAHPGQDLEPVGLEALPPSAAVAVTPPRQLPCDLLRNDAHAGRESLDDGDQRLPVGLAGSEHPQHPPIIGTGWGAWTGRGWGGGGPANEAAPAPATAPPVGGSPGPEPVYFDGVKQSVKDWSPNRNVAQFPATSRSSKLPPANVAPSAG